MTVIHQIIDVETEPGIQIYDITLQLKDFVASTSVQNGHVLVFSRHTTTALAINEYEVRLLEDIKVYLDKLAPAGELINSTLLHRYLHNDLHLRDVPPDEPMNAHSHLMAITLSTSEVIPIADGQLALGTYQSVLFFELDGPRQRTVFVQVSGE